MDQSPTRKGFCQRKGISESFYFKLKAKGETPANWLLEDGGS